MMREERIELSQRERDRLKVLHQVEQGYLTQAEAGQRVQVSARQVRPGLRGAAGGVRTAARRHPTGSASAAPISACGPAPARRRQPPSAYGLPGLPSSETRNRNTNTFPLPITLGGGHFYRAKKRTFLLCVDRSNEPPRQGSPSG